MARFEPVSSGVGSNYSANCATTTASFALFNPLFYGRMFVTSFGFKPGVD